MIEKNNIENLFSKAFENQTAPVRPELWSGVQAKMAAAGVTSVVASKGLSALAKWLIGTAAVGTVGVVSTYLVLSTTPTVAEKAAEQQKSENIKVEEVIPTKGLAVVTEDSKVEEQPVTFTKQEARPSQESFATSYTSVEPKIVPPSERLIPVVLDPIVKPEPKIIAAQPIVVTEEPKRIEKPVQNVSNESAPGNVVLSAEVTKFPNVFTPNNDGQNDFYSIEAENITDARIIILDVKNRVVFETNNIHFKWDGTYHNELLPKGTYACIVTGRDPQGKSFKDTQLFELQ